MKLVFNSGSSSIKVALFKDKERTFDLHFKNYSGESFSLIVNNQEEVEINESDYSDSFNKTIEILINHGALDSKDNLDFIAHRVVHGGEEYDQPVEITEETIQTIESFNDFAPLHNPLALEIIKKIAKTDPNLKQYAVFDTAFHTTIPKKNFLYGLPYGYYENIKVRKFGFHGISYEYIVNNVPDFPSKAIICHLGSGSSVCAVKDKQSFATSFGFSPEENLIMATRSGEIDYSAVMYLKNKLALTDKDITTLINKESGLLGLSGYTNNMVQLIEDYDSNDRAKLAIDMYVDKVVEFISSFYVKLGGCDLLVFTGGIGSGSDFVRKKIGEKIRIIGLGIDDTKNNGQINIEGSLDISINDNRVLAVKTNEELHIINQVSNTID